MSIRASTCQILGRGFTKITLLKEKPPKGYMWSGRRPTKIQTTTRPDHVWSEVWTKMGKSRWESRKNRNGQKKNRSSTKLEDWEEFILLIQTTENTQKFSKNTWRKLGRPMAPAMPCKRHSQASWKRAQNRRLAMNWSSKQCMIVLWNLMNLPDNEQNFCSLKKHQDHIAGKGFTSVTHTNLVP